MGLKTRNKPRKMPRQARARATFEAIIEAAEQVLRRDGLESLTATSVAERAGVSVGSLYQYFPNKEAILEIVAVRRIGELRRSVIGILAENRAEPPAETVEALLSGLVAHLRADAVTLREIMKTEAFDASSPAMSRCLSSLVALFVRCAKRQPGQLRVPPGRLQASIGVLARVVFETCRQTLLGDEMTFFSPDFLEELSLLAHTLLLKPRTMRSTGSHRQRGSCGNEFASFSAGFAANEPPSLFLT